MLIDASKAIHSQIIRLGKLQFDYVDNLDEIPLSLITQSVQFRSSLRFASCGLIDSVDTFAIILPDPSDLNLHQLITIQIERPDGAVSGETEAFISSAESCKENPDNWIKIFREILIRSACVVGSPDSYENLKPEERIMIKSAIKDSTQATWMERIFQKKQS